MKNSIVILFVMLLNITRSQNYLDIFRLSTGTTSQNKFDTGASKTRVDELSLDLTIPVKLNERTSFISGILFENMRTRLFSDGKIESFGSTALKTGLNRKLNDRWSVTGVLLPKIATDYKSFKKEDFQLGALSIAKYAKNDQLAYKFGLYYNSELFGPFFVPMAGFYYLSPGKRFEVNVMLPLQADVNFKLLNRIHAGANFNGQIRTYHLSGQNPLHPDAYVTKSTNEVCLYLRCNLSDNVSVQARVGRSFARSYRVYDSRDKVTVGLPATFIGHTRQQINTDFSDGLIFQFCLLYRFNLNKS